VSRISARDVSWLGVDSAKVVGPLRGVTAEDVRDALLRLHAARPDHHLLGRLDRRRGRWQQLDRASFARWSHRLAVPVDIDDGDALLDRVLAEPLADRPGIFLVGRRHVGFLVNHGAADGRAADQHFAAVLATATGGRPEPASRPGALPLLRAAAHQFLRHPSRLAAAAQVCRAPSRAAEGEPVGWQPRLAWYGARSGPDLLAELRDWRDRHTPGLSLAAVLFAATYSALARHLGPPDPPGMVVLVDARRYLPDGVTVDGNFAWGEHLHPRDPGDPRDVQPALADVIRSRRVLTMLALHNARALVRPWPAPPPRVTTGARPHVTLTHLGRADAYARLPWDSPEQDRRLLSVALPAGPQSVTVAMEELGGALHVTATYHASVFDQDAVAAALQAVTKDPFGLLA
jgi:hypothetical protein